MAGEGPELAVLRLTERMLNVRTGKFMRWGVEQKTAESGVLSLKLNIFYFTSKKL